MHIHHPDRQTLPINKGDDAQASKSRVDRHVYVYIYIKWPAIKGRVAM